MKKIYEFTLPFETEVEETDIKKGAAGEEIKTTKKVKKTVDRKFFIARPNRQVSEDAEIFRASIESELVRRGVIRAQVAQKFLINEGGILSDQEKKQYEVLTENFIKLQGEYSELNLIDDKNKTEEQKQKSEDLIKELSEIMGKLNDLENTSSSLYNRTAEAMARNKTNLWLTLMLSYEDKEGKETPIFSGKTYEDKLKVYDDIEEKEDEFQYKLIKKLLFNVGIYYAGKAGTQEEFDSMNKLYDNQDLIGNI